ncbi:unnamed protein product [Polarella glacialis]|uniref:Uncharacterized protein n=1 Tax=Polarella glacialis TaxID=89957 RepID=A0A813GV90_POLGL|nr:unnamed protein product [Polarella glacialis]
MRLVLAQEPPVPGQAPAPPSAEAAAFITAASAVGRHKLNMDAKPSGSNGGPEEACLGKRRAELEALKPRELKERLASGTCQHGSASLRFASCAMCAGLSAEGCLYKADLIDRLLSKGSE